MNTSLRNFSTLKDERGKQNKSHIERGKQNKSHIQTGGIPRGKSHEERNVPIDHQSHYVSQFKSIVEVIFRYLCDFWQRFDFRARLKEPMLRA